MPRSAPADDLHFIGWEPGPRATSGKAVVSLVLGSLLCLACFSGIPAIMIGSQALGDIYRSGGRLRGRKRAVAGVSLGVVGCLLTLGLFMPAVRASREAARRGQCVNNLKQIGLALHNYHEANGCLPAAATTDKQGRPLLNWRVALLPYLENQALYARFHQDEPWDSPHNLPLLGSMPRLFACPSDPTLQPGMTDYQVVVGAETAFTPDFKPVRLEDFQDGTANTIVVGESSRAVLWTKPEDLPFDLTVPLAGLEGHHGYHVNGFNALFGDGSVRFLKRSINSAILRSYLTRSGDGPYTSDQY